MDNSYLSVLGDILSELRSIEKKVDENSKAIADTKTELKAEIATTKEELRAEMVEMKSELETKMATMKEELQKEIKEAREDILTQASDMAKDQYKVIEQFSYRQNRRFANIEIAVFGKECQVRENDNTTYECKRD